MAKLNVKDKLAHRMSRVTPSAIMETLKVTAGGGFISFASGLPDPDLFPIEDIKGITDDILTKDGRAALQYGPAEGYPPLRELVAARLKQRQLPATPENILITHGSQQSLDLAARAFLDPGDLVCLEIPAYSGRVFLYAPDTIDDLTKLGPTLTVVTNPGMGEVRFRVDGFDYWTCSGRWTTEYVLGPDFGRFTITFDKPGKHTIEVVDVVPADMKTAAGYGSGERLGQCMDPSNPTKPSGKKKFRFREWTGLAQSKDAKIEVDVKESTTLTAEFDVEEKG